MKYFFKKREKQKEMDVQSQSAYEEDQSDVAEKEEDAQFTKTREQKLQYVENCCDQMMTCQKRLEPLKIEYKEINHYLTDIHTIETLDESRREALDIAARRVVNLKEDKKVYKNTSTKMSEKKYEFIRNHEEQMPVILKELKETEDEFQTLKTDLHNIEGEKSALKYERKSAIYKIDIARKLFIIVAFTTLFLLCFFTVFQVKGEYDFTIGYYLVIVTAMAIAAGILVLRQSSERDMRQAELKLNKCIGLLNRYKLRYVNMKSSLDYMYQMYRVQNSYEFSNDWRVYMTAKKEREAFFKMSDSLYKATEEYMEIVDSLNLYDASVWSYQVNAILDDNEMDVIKRTLTNRRDGIKNNMDYNNEVIEKSKSRIKALIEKDPSIAKDVLNLVDRKEREVDMGK